MMLRYCANLNAIRYESTSLNRIVGDKSHRVIAALRGSFFEFGKLLPHPREFDHHFLPRARELDKKICPGGRDSLAQKNFPGGCPGGDVPSWN